MKHRAATLVLASLVVGPLLTVGPARATPSGENGRIAYRLWFNDEHTRAGIFTIDPDGSNKQQVTHPRRGVLNLTPDWSPDGRWIAYVRAPADRLHPRIWRIRPNGTGARSLSSTCTASINCRIDDDPAWSPNGRRIAFTRVFGRDLERVELMVMRADGTHVRNVTHRTGSMRYEDWAPQWSPSGKRLVFHRVDKERGLSAIFTTRLDGTRKRQLTPWKLDAGGKSDWSPDGCWIVFRSYISTDIERSNIWLVHPNGSGLHRITSAAGGSITWLSSTFSPNGLRIVTARAPGVGDAGNADVYVINLDGSGLRNVTQSVRWDSTPDWGPRKT
jgi:Tol biopolymer transport system component